MYRLDFVHRHLIRYYVGQEHRWELWQRCNVWRNFVEFTTIFQVNFLCKSSVSFNIIQFYIDNASRFCHLNATWDDYTNYDLCLHVPDSSAVSNFEAVVELPAIVYYTGYSISLISLTLAVAVFVHFKLVFE